MTKKIILLTLAMVAGVSCSTAIAAKNKKNKKVEEPVKELVVLQSAIDSLCYAGGQAHTKGMMQYATTQLGVDSAYVPQFIEALRQNIYIENTPEAKAQIAAKYIAAMVNIQMANKLKTQFDEANETVNLDLFRRGFLDAVDNDASVMSVDESEKLFNNGMEEMHELVIEQKKAAGKKWLADNKTKEGVQVTPSGLQYKVIREGNGPVATKAADVEVKYEGKLIDGTIFDSSYKRNPQTTSFKPSQVIKGWTEALCMMPEGSEWELYIPENLAYGSRETGSIPPYSTLIFKVEVVKVTPEPVKEETTEPVKEETKKPAAKKPVAKKKK